MPCVSSLCTHHFVHGRGTLVAVPAPDHLAIPNDVYESAVSQAEMEASYEDVRAVRAKAGGWMPTTCSYTLLYRFTASN